MIDQPATPAVAGRIAGAWVLGLAGLVWASLLNFAGSMQTVPSMTIGTALLTIPLPLCTLLLVRSAVVRARNGNGRRVSRFWTVPPVVLALLALFIGWSLPLGLGLS